MKTELKWMAVTIICRIKNNPMNSESPNNDARRTSPRKSAGRMPNYLARESNKEKGGKGVKKSGGGVNKRAVAEESELSSSSDSAGSIQPRKKSRGTTVGRMSGGTRTVRVSRAEKVAKGKKSKKRCKCCEGEEDTGV